MTALAALLLAIAPLDLGGREQVDLIERNHFYDEQGRLIFQQIIFWDWDHEADRFQVRAWRLAKAPAQEPFRDWQSGGWRWTCYDGELLRDVRARWFRETWTQYDPELEEREWVPKDSRRELARPGRR